MISLGEAILFFSTLLGLGAFLIHPASLFSKSLKFFMAPILGLSFWILIWFFTCAAGEIFGRPFGENLIFVSFVIGGLILVLYVAKLVIQGVGIRSNFMLFVWVSSCSFAFSSVLSISPFIFLVGDSYYYLNQSLGLGDVLTLGRSVPSFFIFKTSQNFIGDFYPFFISPFIAFCVLGIICSAVPFDNTNRMMWVKVILLIGGLVSSPMFVINVVLLGNHMFTAAGLVASFVIINSGLSQRVTNYLWPLVLSMAAVLVSRFEGGLLLGLMVFVLFAEKEFDWQSKNMLIIFCGLGLLTSFGFWILMEDSGYISDELYLIQFFLVSSGLLATSYLSRYISLIKRHTLFLITGVSLVSCTALWIGVGGDHLGVSTRSLASNLVSFFWGASWCFLGLGVLMLMGQGGWRLGARELFVLSAFLSGTVLILLFIVLFRASPYRLGWGDSANRIIWQIQPTLFAILGIGFSKVLNLKGGSRATATT